MDDLGGTIIFGNTQIARVGRLLNMNHIEYPPSRLTYLLKFDGWKMICPYVLLKWSLFRGHADFRGEGKHLLSLFSESLKLLPFLVG